MKTPVNTHEGLKGENMPGPAGHPDGPEFTALNWSSALEAGQAK